MGLERGLTQRAQPAMVDRVRAQPLDLARVAVDDADQRSAAGRALTAHRLLPHPFAGPAFRALERLHQVLHVVAARFEQRDPGGERRAFEESATFDHSLLSGGR